MTPDEGTRRNIRMTRPQRRKVNALIRRLCANCFEGNCLLLDDGETTVCPQTLTFSLCCTYFKAAVLPAEPALYAELMEREDTRRCAICGAAFFSTSNAAKYCRPCAQNVRRRQTAESVRKTRANVSK